MSLAIPFTLRGFQSHIQSELVKATIDFEQAKRERLPWLTAHALPVYFWKRLATVFSDKRDTDEESESEYVRKEVVFQDCTKTVRIMDDDLRSLYNVYCPAPPLVAVFQVPDDFLTLLYDLLKSLVTNSSRKVTDEIQTCINLCHAVNSKFRFGSDGNFNKDYDGSIEESSFKALDDFFFENVGSHIAWKAEGFRRNGKHQIKLIKTNQSFCLTTSSDCDFKSSCDLLKKHFSLDSVTL